MSLKVYLSGKMAGRPGKEVLAERKKAVKLCKQYGLIALDPGKNENIPNTEALVSGSFDYSLMKRYVAKDEYDINNSDVLLVITGDTASDGTWMEIGQAIWHCRIPVVVVCPRRISGELMGFLNVKSTAMFATIEEAILFISENFAKPEYSK